jgi:site-specific DNA-methyltransferase (adenine-specific)
MVASDEVVSCFPDSKSCNSPSKARPEGTILGGARSQGAIYPGETGSAARFFYCAKASKRDRDEGLEGFEEKTKKVSVIQTVGVGLHGESEDGKQISLARNHHPTVKPTDLMRYLCRLVTPPNGLVLDPFTGSGSTGKAAVLEGFRFVGIEREAEYIELARARIEEAIRKSLASLQKSLFD